jgi:hypothetical protein
MNRDEMIALRKELLDVVQKLRKLGDYSAGAGDIRFLAETMLKLADHLLERMR